MLIHEREIVRRIMATGRTYLSSLQSGLNGANGSFELLANEDMSGTTAEKIKECVQAMNDVAKKMANDVIVDLIMAIEIYSAASEAFDGDNSAVIPEENLESLQTSFDSSKAQRLSELAVKLAGYANDAAQACSVLSVPVGTTYNCEHTADSAGIAVSEVGTASANALAGLQSLENGTAGDDGVTSAQKGAAALTNLLRSVTSSFKAGNFDKKAITQSGAFRDAQQAKNEMDAAIVSNTAAYSQSIETNNKIYQEMVEEYESRQRTANIVKWIGVGVCAVAGIAATVVSGGVLAPVVAGVIAGGVTSAAESYFDQRVGTVAGVGTVDIGKCVFDGVGGAVIGGVGAGIGAGTGIISQGAGLAKKAVIKGVGKVVTGVVSNAVEDVSNAVYGEAGGEDKNFGDYVIDAVFDFAAGAAGSAVGDVISDKLHIPDMSTEKTFGQNAAAAAGNVFVVDLPKSVIGSVVSGVGDQVTDVVAHGESWDWGELGEDVLSDTVSGVVDSAFEQVIDLGAMEVEGHTQFMDRQVHANNGKATVDDVDGRVTAIGKTAKGMGQVGDTFTDQVFPEEDKELEAAAEVMNAPAGIPSEAAAAGAPSGAAKTAGAVGAEAADAAAAAAAESGVSAAADAAMAAAAAAAGAAGVNAAAAAVAAAGVNAAADAATAAAAGAAGINAAADAAVAGAGK